MSGQPRHLRSGCDAVECLTGHLAHEGTSEAAFLKNLMTKPASIPPDLPEPWRTLIAHCLERDPRKRAGAMP